ncbi:hypothetical protein F2P45_31745 [Massilia sp. CCM 8733]|uniref:SGNH hydrolase-type esterase domain-containing protein n=1 Tax=Massilia mucilaginosa TaxID=2609282 RepID=A0ABX0P3V3_9BURK|nr:hypothetical protein [Massilia mucilaginosa]NHZ93541.1 hypothetical protein [Massilia mucilaginosa]
MAKTISISAEVDTASLSVAVTAAPGSAGIAVAYALASSSVMIANTSLGATVQYKVGSGAWLEIPVYSAVPVEVNLSYEQIMLRRARFDGGECSVRIDVDSVPRIRAGGSTLAKREQSARQLRMAIFGDSLSDGGAPGRAAGILDGRPWYGSTTVVTPANFGGLTWLYNAMVDGRAGAAGNGIGTIETDARCWMRWTYLGDTPGPWIDVSTGGFFVLPSGTFVNSGIFVKIRGATPGVPNASSLVNTAGIPSISDYNLLGYVPWLVGQLGATFTDYQTFAIPGATSADALKFVPQGLLTPLAAALLLIGTNDSPDTPAKAQASAANIIAAIDLIRVKVEYLAVGEPPPNINATQTVNKFMGVVGDIVSAYCASLKGNVEYISSWDRMVASGASVIGSGAGARPGAYFDDIHLMPFGGNEFAAPYAAAFLRRFSRAPSRRHALRTWDSTARAGSFNLNPTFRGTAGIFGGATPTAAGNGVTGTVPDGWTLTRVAGVSGTATQTCTTAFEASPDGGLSRYTMDVAGASQGDYHELSQQFNVPANMTAGEFFQFLTETQTVAANAIGLAIWQAQCVAGGNIQSSYVFQTGRDVANFTVEGPMLELRGEPQKMLSGFTLFTIRIRVGARTGGGTGKVGLRVGSMDRAQ